MEQVVIASDYWVGQCYIWCHSKFVSYQSEETYKTMSYQTEVCYITHNSCFYKQMFCKSSIILVSHMPVCQHGHTAN